MGEAYLNNILSLALAQLTPIKVDKPINQLIILALHVLFYPCFIRFWLHLLLVSGWYTLWKT
jgi:hypothetical protein